MFCLLRRLLRAGQTLVYVSLHAYHIANIMLQDHCLKARYVTVALQSQAQRLWHAMLLYTTGVHACLEGLNKFVFMD